MSETAYSHAVAQRDVEIADLKREIAELRQVMSESGADHELSECPAADPHATVPAARDIYGNSGSAG